MDSWEGLLLDTGIIEANKLAILMASLQQATSSMMSDPSITARAQRMRSLLERVKAECDECYCFDCYGDIHSGGKRASHAWLGFKENAPACRVCVRSPAQVYCHECSESLCEACYKVLHGMGRKKRHRRELILEENPMNASFCGLCSRRVATLPCPQRCGVFGCDSCILCVHVEDCSKRPVDTLAASKAEVPVKMGKWKADKEKEHDLANGNCSVCGQLAELRCTFCEDLYCSRKKHGSLICFSTNHNKGNRVSHKTERI